MKDPLTPSPSIKRQAALQLDGCYLCGAMGAACTRGLVNMFVEGIGSDASPCAMNIHRPKTLPQGQLFPTIKTDTQRAVARAAERLSWGCRGGRGDDVGMVLRMLARIIFLCLF